MYYAVRHITRYRYSSPVRENVMEARMQPRSEDSQRCLKFDLSVDPRASVSSYQDYLGNVVHHFDIPGQHVQLTVAAEALVEVQPPPVPEVLPPAAWTELDRLGSRVEFWDTLQPSRFAQPTPLLHELAAALNLSRRADPLTLLRELNKAIYSTFAYAPQSTRVDSPIDEALAARRGVCQDFSHIMIALVRQLGIPCRYVSGYLFHRLEDQYRSDEDSSHAWLEAFLPDLGWIGFDPTNNLLATERHIRVGIGRDYADVPPTRGVFKGNASDELSVGVRVTLTDEPREADETILPDTPWTPPLLEEAEAQWQQQQ